MRCRKKDQVCTYRHLMLSYNPFDNESHTKQPISPATSMTLAQSSMNSTFSPLYTTPSTLDLATLELISHYTSEVSSAFASSAVQVGILPCFHDAIIQYSSSYPYVYHAMLSVSALHLASLTTTTSSRPPSLQNQNRSPHLITALSHKTSALETLHVGAIISSINTTTCKPAIAASGLLAVCAFAMLHAGMTLDTIDLLAQIMALYRGTIAILHFGRQDPRLLVLSHATTPPAAGSPSWRQWAVKARG